MTATNGQTGDAPPATPGSAPARDLRAGLVVFLVALPLCLGIAVASNAPLFAGVVAGVGGGILVGLSSGSHTSVSGPAAGMAAVVAAQVAVLAQKMRKGRRWAGGPDRVTEYRVARGRGDPAHLPGG